MKQLLNIKTYSILTSIIFTFFFTASGQNATPKKCLSQYLKETPEAVKKRLENDFKYKKWAAKNEQVLAGDAIAEIPVVVHVLYKTSTENIGDAKIIRQLEILNEDYSMQNPNSGNTIQAFKSLAGDTKIRFVLATTDPNGNPTTGINRKQTTKNGFDYTSNEAKFTSMGGIDAWPSDKYLNIWVVNTILFQNIPGTLGYAQFPDDPRGPATDGVVIVYNAFGDTPPLIPGIDGGRTATHEVGHWLGLRHLWGLDPNDGCNAADDDLIADTPMQESASSGCNTSRNTCGNLNMVQNFMDYSDDACMTLFTNDQIERIAWVIDNYRSDFKINTNNFDYDVDLVAINNVGSDACGTYISPEIKIYNAGVQTLTSVDVSFTLNGNLIKTESKSLSLVSGSSIDLTFNPIAITNFGANALQVELTRPNNQIDEDPTNNSESLNFNITSGQLINFTISESSINTSISWTIKDGGNTIEDYNSVSKASAGGMQSQEFCLAENKCYDFEINDAFVQDLCSQYPTYNSAVQYQAGDQFVYNGTLYEAKQLIWGSDPVTFSHFYNNLGPCPSPDPNDYFTLTNVTANQEIANITLGVYTGTYSENFCIDLASNIVENSSDAIRVYPNPTQGTLTFNTTIDQVVVYDTFGKFVLQASNVSSLTLPALANGVYTVKSIKGGDTQFIRIVKF